MNSHSVDGQKCHSLPFPHRTYPSAQLSPTPSSRRTTWCSTCGLIGFSITAATSSRPVAARANTGVPLGDPADRFVWAITGDRLGPGAARVRDKGRIRLGTRFITENGHDVSVADLIFASGGIVTEDGLVQKEPGGPPLPFLWTFTEMLPKPEDYVLQRSSLHTETIGACDVLH